MSENIKLNKNGNNANIVMHILSDEEMRKLGFTDYDPKHWYICKGIKDEITFNVSIDKKDPTEWRIDVLDEDFCQPYDYQYMLERNPNNKFAKNIMNIVEEYMKELKEAGIISGHEYGEYI